LAEHLEDSSIDSPIEDIDDQFEKPVNEISNLPASLICNLDEMGFGEYEDAQFISILWFLQNAKKAGPIFRSIVQDRV
jgi:hypothetical protein